jgi:ligand-binding sensor domain-containing protein/signal transduction histidine kinase
VSKSPFVCRKFPTYPLIDRCCSALSLAGSLVLCLAAAGAALPTDESGFGVVVRSWDTSQGLPQNSVTVLLQTRDGYLWVGTKSGLARFDGVRFRQFGLQDGLTAGAVSALLEARDGALWVGTPDRGVFRWQDGRVTNLCAELSNRQVTALAETAGGTIWIGTGAGLDRWNGGQLAHQGAREGVSNVLVRTLYVDRSGTLWAASGIAGIFQLRDEKFVPEPAPFAFPAHKQGYCFLEDRDAGLWLSIGDGFLLRKSAGSWQTYSSESNGVPWRYVDCLAQTVNGTLWAGSSGEGLAYFNGNRFLRISKENGLSDDFVLSAVADREGNLWAGTLVGGLNRLARKQLVTLAEPEGLTNAFIRSIAESADGALWVVTRNGGLYRGDHDHFVQYLSPNIPEDNTAAYNWPGVYLNSDSILAAQDGTLWLGGRQRLFHLGNTSSKMFGLNGNPSWLEDDTVTTLAEDASHAVWIGTSSGQIVVSRKGEFFTVPGVSRNVPVAAITCTADGTVWAGTSGSGVLQLRNNTLVSTLTSRQGLGSDFITALAVGRDGTLWIATDGGGLSHWKDGRCLQFSARQGLPESPISQILEDEDGDLWLGSMHGICRVKRSDLEALATQQLDVLQPLMIGEAEGMLAEECCSGSSPNCFKSRNGRLYFSTVKGLVVIDPRHYRPADLPPITRLEEVVFNGKIISENGDGGKVVIPPGRGNFEFHYTGLGNAVLEKVQFHYRLTSADSAWVEVGTRRTAYYSQLPPGKYHFEVIARSGEEHWPPNGASLDLVLQPYFYETWWFFASLLGLAAIAVIQIVRTISYRKFQRRLHWIEMQNAVEKERTRIAKDIHDDLGASLTQVTMLSEHGQAANPQSESVSQTFAKIAEKTVLCIQAMDEIVWAVNPKNDNLPRLARYICRHADECFDSSDIRCWQIVPEDLPNLVVRADVRHNLFLAVKEALHNVLKHSQASQIWLEIRLRDRVLQIEIKDNGCGFSVPQADFNRNGLRNMKTRMAEIGGSSECDSQPGGGTRVHFAVNLPATGESPAQHGISMP